MDNLEKFYKVSIIMPVYNAEKYIEETLKSVINQSMKDFEIILINDGSKDSSVKVINSILKNSNIDYRIINQQNLGVAAARNAGISLSNGKYLCFIDSDDIIEPNHIENLYNAISENFLKLGFTEFELTTIHNRYGKKTIIHEYIIEDSATLQNNFLNRKVKITCTSLLIQKKFILDNGLLFNEELKFAEDAEYLWRLFTSIESAAWIKAKTYKYLTHENSLMTEQSINRILLFLDSFLLTVQKLKFRGNINKDIVYSRVTFGILHSCAKYSSYTLFKSLLNGFDYKVILKKVNKIDDKRIILFKDILLISPRVFWIISKRV